MHSSGTRVLNEISSRYRDLLLKDIEEKKILLEEVKSCICCGSTDFETLLDIDRFELPFGSYLCKTCGLVSTSPRIVQESLPYYYETYYHPLNYGKESLENQTALFQEGQGKKIFTKTAPYLHKSNIAVLEIGAGVGNVLDEFRAEAKRKQITVEVLGTEYSPECITQCRHRDVEVIEGNAASVLSLNKKFDIIILSHVFEHFIDLRKELDILCQLLHNDGILYVEVPGILKIHNKHYYDFSFVGYSVHAHMYNFTSTTLKNMIAQHGFSLKESNEEVESIFQVTPDTKDNIESDYLRIHHYLSFLEDFRCTIKEQEKICQEKIDHQLGRIEYRDKDILKYKIQVENRNKEIALLKKELENRNASLHTIWQTLHKLVNLKLYKNPLEKYRAYKQLIKDIDATKER